MTIFNLLNECKTAEDLSNFLINLQPSIGKLGGRRFCVKDQVGSISLRDIVKRLDEIYKSSLIGKTCSSNITAQNLGIAKFINDYPQILNDEQVIDDLYQIESLSGLQEILIKNTQNQALILQAEGKEISLFRPFLARKTDYFNSIASFREGKALQISLQEDSPEAIQLLFSFLKTGQVVLTFENAIEGLVIADKYQVKELKDKCQRWIMDNCNLTCDNVIEWLAIADKSQAEELKDECQIWIWNQNGDTFNLWEIVDKFDATLLREALLQQAVASKDISILRERGQFLNELVLTNESSEDVLELLQFCPNISYLQLISCQWLKDLKKIMELKNLTSLKLFNCKQLTDIGELISPNLTHLSLSCCQHLNNISELTLTNLSSLNLSGCDQLTDAAVKEIAAGLPTLINLNLGWCEQLTDEAVKEIAARLPTLTSLDLSGCKQLTDELVFSSFQLYSVYTHSS